MKRWKGAWKSWKTVLSWHCHSPSSIKWRPCLSRDVLLKRARKHLQVHFLRAFVCLQRRKMAHLEFCIPATSRDELVQSSKKGQYIVRRLLSDPAEIEQKVEGKWFRERYTQSLVNHLSCLVYVISLPSFFFFSNALFVQRSEYRQLVLSDGPGVVYECFDAFYSVCEWVCTHASL